MRIFEARIAVVTFLALVPAAHAEDVTDAVPGHPGVTYETLLRQAMPDLAKSTDGHWTSSKLMRLRGLDGKPETDADLAFDDITPIKLREGGHERLAVLTGDSQTGSGFSAVLAVFDAAPATPKLLDYMDVGGDRFVGLGSPKTLAIAADSDAVIVDNNHFNSNQNYSQDTILYLDRGRLRVAFTQFTLNSGFCGYEERQVPVYSVHDVKGSKYRAISVSVTQTVTRSDETCDEGTKILKASKHTYTDVYSWDAKKNDFVTHTNAMKALMQPDE
ncbi:MAG TPA: hypothetical protein VJ476_00960 [Rhizomicrobium sp.]|nr:hypothetical protein [Rhizomicrobium sp.]